MLDDRSLRVRRNASSACAVIAVAAWVLTLLVLARNSTVASTFRTEFGEFGVTGATAIITASVLLLVATLVIGWRGARAPRDLITVFVVTDVVVMILIGVLSLSVVTFETGAGIMLISGWLFALPSIVELVRARLSRH
ncbi:hypothetical protein [Actinokineospora enzanensis]|uniref:hypothetical protein n=1 Tax=Actinokineospora enzanensis TaxID=155975 RepID=UPI0012EC4D04|nr:hypothetical protein [Actinokineospora enzanensis]